MKRVLIGGHYLCTYTSLEGPNDRHSDFYTLPKIKITACDNMVFKLEKKVRKSPQAGKIQRMEPHFITDIKEFRNLAVEWDKAVIQTEGNNPFLLSDFILSWWKHCSKNKKLMIYILTAEARDQIVSGIPLCLERKELRRTISHIGGCDANITHFFSKDPSLNLVDHLLSSLQKRTDWDLLVLDRVLVTNPLLKQIEHSEYLRSKRFISFLFDAGFNGVVDLSEGFQAISTRMNKRLRRYLANSKREIEKRGELKLHRIRGSLKVKKLFKSYVDLSVRSFRRRGKISAFEDATRRQFYEELLILFDLTDRLDAHKLTVGNDLFGISFGYRFGRGFKWILTTFNPEFSDLRPGHLLIEALIKEAVQRGDPYFDMYYGGETFYKQQWCTNMIPLKRIEICPNTFINRALSLSRNALRSNPRIVESARKIRTLAQKTFK